ncbi:MAG: acyl-CoA thioesterase [Gemmatimonadota bacterium]|nr:acyl-CoA thioesterase [Gemmatimonadota bacterium]
MTEVRVRYAETDQMGVVYHANYFAWCDIGRTDLIRALGGPTYAELERDGVALAVVEAHLRFVRPARYDDVVRINTSVTEVRSRVVRFDYDLTASDGSPIAEGYTTLVAMSRDGRGSSIPPTLRQHLERVRVER